MRHQSGLQSPATLLSVAFAALALLESSAFSATDSAGLAKWEPEIKAFEAADRTNPPPHDAILFVGSSSIRKWTTLSQDFSGFKVINRGFGGSQIADSTAFAGRIIIPYRPKTIALYAGDNDIAAGKSAEEVFQDFKRFTEKMHDALPQTRILFISIKPSPSRWHLAENIRAANRLIENLCRRDEKLVYVDIFHPMLGDDGQPRTELFVEDRLHMNRKGYELWTSLVKPLLKE